MKDVIKVSDILLPRLGVDLEKWAVVACDQFTSQPEYWKEVESFCEGAPSTFNLIYPEVYLNEDKEQRIETINSAMESYLACNLFRTVGNSFILVERDTKYQKGRLGLMMAVDLETYDYTPFAPAYIRATEGTIVDRIPPRVQIRRHASLELPHIMLLIDDRDNTVIEPLYENRDTLELLYDTDLNMGGGHIRGYKVENTDEILAKIYALLDNDVQKKKYGEVTNFLFAVGDGNHSLATAKAHWEEIKKTITADKWQNHPARFALVEVENLHGDALMFEPIHRVVFGAGEDFEKVIVDAMKGPREVIMFTRDKKYVVHTEADSIDAIKAIQDFIDNYIKTHEGVSVDYVHGADYLAEVVEKHNGVGIIMPAPEKNSLFDFIIRKGVMPRKSFSMGEAEEKRYYLEAKKIVL